MGLSGRVRPFFESAAKLADPRNTTMLAVMSEHSHLGFGFGSRPPHISSHHQASAPQPMMQATLAQYPQRSQMQGVTLVSAQHPEAGHGIAYFTMSPAVVCTATGQPVRIARHNSAPAIFPLDQQAVAHSAFNTAGPYNNGARQQHAHTPVHPTMVFTSPPSVSAVPHHHSNVATTTTTLSAGGGVRQGSNTVAHTSVGGGGGAGAMPTPPATPMTTATTTATMGAQQFAAVHVMQHGGAATMEPGAPAIKVWCACRIRIC